MQFICLMQLNIYLYPLNSYRKLKSVCKIKDKYLLNTCEAINIYIILYARKWLFSPKQGYFGRNSDRAAFFLPVIPSDSQSISAGSREVMPERPPNCMRQEPQSATIFSAPVFLMSETARLPNWTAVDSLLFLNP